LAAHIPLIVLRNDYNSWSFATLAWMTAMRSIRILASIAGISQAGLLPHYSLLAVIEWHERRLVGMRNVAVFIMAKVLPNSACDSGRLSIR